MSDAPLVLGHRGDHQDAPENSLASFLSATRSCDGVEFDVRACRDRLVVHHDEWCRVRARRRRLNGLARADLPPRVPALADVVAWARTTPRFLLDVEVKEPLMEERILEELAPILGRPGLVVTSFYPDILFRIRELSPKTRIGMISKVWTDELPAIVEALGAQLAVLRRDLARSSRIEAFRTRGIETWVWGEDTLAGARRLGTLGVRAFITDRPDRLAPIRAQPGGAARRRTIRRTGPRGN